MKKLLLIAMLCLTFTIPAKADFWKKLKNAVTGTGSSSSSSNSSGKTGGTRGYLITDEYGSKIIVNPFDKNDYQYEKDIYSRERNAIYKHRDLQGTATKVNYIECRIIPGGFLYAIGRRSFYGYVEFPVYEIIDFIDKEYVLGCFSRDKSGKEKEISGDVYLGQSINSNYFGNEKR